MGTIARPIYRNEITGPIALSDDTQLASETLLAGEPKEFGSLRLPLGGYSRG